MTKPETLPHALLTAYLEESPFLPEAPGRTAWFLGLIEAAYAAGQADARLAPTREELAEGLYRSHCEAIVQFKNLHPDDRAAWFKDADYVLSLLARRPAPARYSPTGRLLPPERDRAAEQEKVLGHLRHTGARAR